MSFLKQLAGETTIYGMGHVLPRLLNYIFLTPVLTRLLTQEDYAIHGFYYALAGMMMIIFTYRLETAFFRFGSEKKDRQNYFSTAFTFIFFSSFLLLIVLYFFKDRLAEIMTSANHSRFIVYCALMIALDAVAAIPFARLRLEQKALRYTWLKIINVLLIIGLTLFFLIILPWCKEEGIFNHSFFSNESRFVDFIFISNIIASGFILILLLFQFKKIDLNFNIGAFRKMIRYSIPLIPVGIAGIINMSGDQWFIINILSPDLDSNLADSGVYVAAKRIAIIMSLFVTAYNYAFEPFIFRNAKKDNAKWMYAKTAQAFTVLSCILILGVLLFIDIIQLILGADFREGIFIVPISILAFFFLGLYYNFSIWYKLTDKTYIGAVIAIVGALITISLNLLLLPRIGYIGSAIASLACFFTMCIMCLIWGKKHFPVPYNLTKMSLYVLVAVIFYTISIIVDTYGNMSPALIWSLRIILFLSFISFAYMREKRDLIPILQSNN